MKSSAVELQAFGKLARDIEDLLDDPEATVEVTIRTLSYEDGRSPKRFLGAGLVRLF